MTAALLCIPLLSAFAGWMTIRLAIYFLFHPKKPVKVFHFRLQGAYYKKEKTLKAGITALIKKELVESEKLTTILAAPGNIRKLRPELEQHIDVFLKIKLKEAMPMIGMLIGDRTINQLKSLFMQELETLFPSVMNSYVKHIITDEGVERLVAARLNTFDADRVEQLLHDNASQELRNLQWLAVITGLIIGCLQLLIIIFLLP